MGKRRKTVHNAHPPSKSAAGSQKSQNGKPLRPQKQKKPKPKPSQQHDEPTIPFSPEHKILLVGDGDLSFAASLVEHHYCADVTATVLEKDYDELVEKYPHAPENIAKIEAEDSRVLYNIDATEMAPFVDKKGKDGTGIMDRIIFNFPHVGGKSTDVNRQVRYNQELLVEFFKRAMPSLAPGGSIIVTLFEGEPYTLWNIRDLARHCGLQVGRSFRFQTSAYPDYHHARTLGVVKSKSGEVGGGWKGEDRAARSYVFVRKDEVPIPASGGSKKRSRDDESSDDD
ncbi:hypothetical protein GGR54DRAFT_642230 [Hypoxylon sp. NC1633]|nr:hypothetical protein GGR54DRAFT_642230 [Hypoxylon sp. NC1633]